jgi:hypothetical protein
MHRRGDVPASDGQRDRHMHLARGRRRHLRLRERPRVSIPGALRADLRRRHRRHLPAARFDDLQLICIRHQKAAVVITWPHPYTHVKAFTARTSAAAQEHAF